MPVTYVNTSFGSDICRFALPILAEGPTEQHVIGSAVMITPGLAMTARHVIDECLKVYDGVAPAEPGVTQNLNATFHLRLVQFVDGGKDARIWHGRRVHTSAYTDIAFIELLRPDGAEQQPSLQMTIEAPEVGDRVFAFGYPRGVIEPGTMPKVTLDPRTTSGTVVELFERGRDRLMMPHPCFHTDAVFDAGMSGGPVFDAAGRVCGIVSTSTPPMEEGGSWASFASLLWPAFATRLFMNRADRPADDVGYPALDLVRAGLLHLEGWNRVVVEDGDRPGLRLDGS